MVAGQGRGLHREVGVEGGHQGAGLDQLVVQDTDQVPGTGARGGVQIQVGHDPGQLGDRGVHADRLAQGRRDRLVDAHHRPVPGDVHPHVVHPVAAGDDLGALRAGAAGRAQCDGGAVDGGGGLLDELLGQAAHGVVVPVGHVGLQGSELGVVGGVHALVAEVAADLEDRLHARHRQALEVELGGDAQEHLGVVGVEVGDEGAGVGPAVDGLEDGGLHLRVAGLPQGGAQGGHHGGALAQQGQGLGVAQELGGAGGRRRHRAAAVALAVGPGAGQPAQGLGQDGPAGHGQARLPGTGQDRGALGHQDVAAAHVPAPGGQVHHGGVQEELEAVVATDQVDEDHAAVVALQAHAPLHPQAGAVPGVGGRGADLLRPGGHLGAGLGGVETGGDPHRVGVHAAPGQVLQGRAALALLVGQAPGGHEGPDVLGDLLGHGAHVVLPRQVGADGGVAQGPPAGYRDEPLQDPGGQGDLDELGGVHKAHVPGAPGGTVLGVGLVELLELPEAGGQAHDLGQGAGGQGGVHREPVHEDGAEHGEVQGDDVDAHARALGEQGGDHGLVDPVGGRGAAAHDVQRGTAHAPGAEAQERLGVAVHVLDRDHHLALVDVGQGAVQGHGEAALLPVAPVVGGAAQLLALLVDNVTQAADLHGGARGAHPADRLGHGGVGAQVEVGGLDNGLVTHAPGAQARLLVGPGPLLPR